MTDGLFTMNEDAHDLVERPLPECKAEAIEVRLLRAKTQEVAGANGWTTAQTIAVFRQIIEEADPRNPQ